MPDLTSLGAAAGALLKEHQQSIAVAESSCGGLISAALVSVPGASDYYVGGSTIYTRVAQKGLLLVPDETMEGMRASSEPYALLNATTIRNALGTVWGLAETGASGPTGNRYGDSSSARRLRSDRHQQPQCAAQLPGPRRCGPGDHLAFGGRSRRLRRPGLAQQS